MEVLRDGVVNDNLQPGGKSSNDSGVLQMKRAPGLIPSVPALACTDTVALPGYAPPPSAPFTREYTVGIIGADELQKLRSQIPCFDRKLNFPCGPSSAKG